MKNSDIYFGIGASGLKAALGVLAIFILIVAFDNTMNMALRLDAKAPELSLATPALMLSKAAVFVLIIFYFVAALFALKFIFSNVRRCIAGFKD